MRRLPRAIGVLARLIQRERGGAGGGPAHTSIAQGALVPTMMHWARAETPGPMFAFGLPKDLHALPVRMLRTASGSI